MSFSFGSQPNVQALDVAFSIFTEVDTAFYDVEYPEHDWYKVLNEDQVIKNINAGATSYSSIVRDKKGTATFIGNGQQNNITKVKQTAGAVSVPVQASAIGADITNEDARQYSFGFNANLAQDLGEVMRYACDNLIELTTFFGDDSVGFRGFLNYEGITVTNAQAGAGGDTEWSTKTAKEMVSDVQDNIRKIWIDSNSVFLPGAIFLPLEQWSLLNDTPFTLGAGDATAAFDSALSYLKRNNLYTQRTGKELEVIPIRYLKGAGVGSTDRMVVQDRSKRNQGMPMPMAYTLTNPVPAPLGAEFFSEQKHGSYFIRQSLSTIFVDGI